MGISEFLELGNGERCKTKDKPNFMQFEKICFEHEKMLKYSSYK